ncbi:unnamed protein product [Alternaria alternata]
MTARISATSTPYPEKPWRNAQDSQDSTVGAASESSTSPLLDNGKVRASQRDRDEDDYTDGDSSNGDESSLKRKREKIHRPFVCTYKPCEKRYGKLKHLKRHELSPATMLVAPVNFLEKIYTFATRKDMRIPTRYSNVASNTTPSRAHNPHTLQIVLTPASAALFAPRSSAIVALASKVEPWLRQTLNKFKPDMRPLSNVQEYREFLKEVVSQPSAIWSLCSIMVSKAPDSELCKDSNPLVEALFNYQLIYIEAYIVYVDMVSRHEVAFKLTPETIEVLIEYHKDIYSVDVSASTWEWAEKEQQLKKLQDEFFQAVHGYVFRTGVKVLEGLENNGTGELFERRSEDAKKAIEAFFFSLCPPPPMIV